MNSKPQYLLNSKQSVTEIALPVFVGENYKASALLGVKVYSVGVVPGDSSDGLVGPPVNELLGSLGGYSKRYRQGYLDSLSVILLAGLSLSRFQEETQDPSALYALCLPRRDQNFKPKSRYRVNAIGHTQWCKVIDRMVCEGFLTKLGGGYRGKGHFSGISTLYSLTDKLIKWFEQTSTNMWLEQLSDHRETIYLKTKEVKTIKGKPVAVKLSVDYEDDDTTRSFRDQLLRITEVCQAHRFTVLPKGKMTREFLPPTMLDYTRSFRDDFEGGGRVYCRAQCISQESRKTLTIDGRPTVELDYKSHQIRILYHSRGVEAETDCYADPHLPRSLIKAATTRVMNCSDEKQAVRVLSQLLKEEESKQEGAATLPEGLSTKGLLEAVLRLNPIIKDAMSDTLWRELQYIESCIALGIMDVLASNGVPCLGIHDSFVVPKDAENLLRQLMMEKYYERLGFYPIVSEA